MTTAVFLVVLGVLARFLPHPPNAVPLGAIALYAGLRLPRRVAIAVPLAVMVLSDVIIQSINGWPFHPASQLTTYATFAALAWFASSLPKPLGAFSRLGLAAVGSTAFYLVSNFVVWAEGSGFGFAHDAPGLLATYTVALPFYGNSLAADLLGVVCLFALEGVIARLAERLRPAPASVVAPAVVPVGVSVHSTATEPM
jgi:hypothetical protein